MCGANPVGVDAVRGARPHESETVAASATSESLSVKTVMTATMHYLSSFRQRGCFAAVLRIDSHQSARGAASPREGPCPPFSTDNSEGRTFFQPDTCGLQAIS